MVNYNHGLDLINDITSIGICVISRKTKEILLQMTNCAKLYQKCVRLQFGRKSGIRIWM